MNDNETREIKKLRTVLVFGAGASCDSGIDDDRYQLPLSKDIFNSEIPAVKKVFHKGDWPIIKSRLAKMKDAIDNEYGGDLEKFLDILVKTKQDPPLENELRWYIQELTLLDPPNIPSKSNYTAWMQKLWSLERKGLLMISDIINFNYDPMLDWSVRSELGLPPSPKHYLSGPVRYIKPHGSSDWIASKNIFDFANQDPSKRKRLKIDSAQRLAIKGSVIDNIKVVDVTGLNNEMRDIINIPFPALVLPIVTKQISTELFPELAVAMRDSILKADHVILIGYRGADQDFVSNMRERIDNPSRNDLIVSIVGKSGAEEVFEKIKINTNSKKYNKLHKGFIFTQGFSEATEFLVNSNYSLSKEGLLILYTLGV